MATNPIIKVHLEVLNINGYLRIVNAHRANNNEAVENGNNEPANNDIVTPNNNGVQQLHNAVGQQILAYIQE